MRSSRDLDEVIAKEIGPRALIRGLIVFLVFARFAGAQATGEVKQSPGTTVTGIVYDSIAGKPIDSAIVQLVSADNPSLLGRTTVSDALGRFTLADITNGRYMLGFLHPVLDSLGVDIPMREVIVSGNQRLQVDLAIPSPARIRAALCGTEADKDSTGVLTGFVRDARDLSPAAGVTVTGEWLEFTFGATGFSRRMPRRVVKTGDNGWFAMCNVPVSGTVALIATRGADSTGLVEVQIPAEGFARRELYIGAAQTVVMVDTTKRGQAVSTQSRPMHVGEGHLSGTVVAAVGGKPLTGAFVTITGGPETRTNERGEWTLVNAPVGTRSLEVRAIGYYPERRHVDIVERAAPVRIALATMKAVLATVKVRATRAYDQNMIGFAARRRSGMGHYVTAADIARHPALETTDIFRRIPGLRVEYTAYGETVLTMRGRFTDVRCTPAIYIDEHYMRDLTADMINMWARPKNIIGIEVYVEGMVPAQFDMGPVAKMTEQGGMVVSTCGTIVIWTK